MASTPDPDALAEETRHEAAVAASTSTTPADEDYIAEGDDATTESPNDAGWRNVPLKLTLDEIADVVQSLPGCGGTNRTYIRECLAEFVKTTSRSRGKYSKAELMSMQETAKRDAIAALENALEELARTIAGCPQKSEKDSYLVAARIHLYKQQRGGFDEPGCTRAEAQQNINTYIDWWWPYLEAWQIKQVKTANACCRDVVLLYCLSRIDDFHDKDDLLAKLGGAYDRDGS